MKNDKRVTKNTLKRYGLYLILFLTLTVIYAIIPVKGFLGLLILFIPFYYLVRRIKKRFPDNDYNDNTEHVNRNTTFRDFAKNGNKHTDDYLTDGGSYIICPNCMFEQWNGYSTCQKCGETLSEAINSTNNSNLQSINDEDAFYSKSCKSGMEVFSTIFNVFKREYHKLNSNEQKWQTKKENHVFKEFCGITNIDEKAFMESIFTTELTQKDYGIEISIRNAMGGIESSIIISPHQAEKAKDHFIKNKKFIFDSNEVDTTNW